MWGRGGGKRYVGLLEKVVRRMVMGYVVPSFDFLG